MIFDRYEIHIQACLYFTNGKWIISRSSSPPKYFSIYNHFCIYKNQDLKISKLQNFNFQNSNFRKFQNYKNSKILKFPNSKSSRNGYTHDPKFSKFLILRYPKIIFFQDVPVYFLIFCEVFWCLQRQIKLVVWARWRVKTLRNHEIWSFRRLK